MKIQEVKNAFKIATTEIIGNKVCINYLDKIYDENGKELSKSILRENVSRVYFIVVDDEIYKIGGSQDNNGMKGTLNISQTGGVNGRPSIRSYGIYKLLYKTLKSNKRIDFYMMYMPNFVAEIKGLFGTKEINNASLSFKFLELSCLEDYKKIEGKYPAWNFQENHEPWDVLIQEEYSELLKVKK